MKSRIHLFAEQIGESTCACLVTMVQGNVLLLSLGHWLVAAQTGVAAGTIATVFVLMGRSTKPWIISAVLGAVTALVDFLVHPGSGLAVFTQALWTGLGAGLLSMLVTRGMGLIRRMRRSFIRDSGSSREACGTQQNADTGVRTPVTPAPE